MGWRLAHGSDGRLQGVGEQLGDVDGGYFGEVVDLVTATGAAGHHFGAGGEVVNDW